MAPLGSPGLQDCCWGCWGRVPWAGEQLTTGGQAWQAFAGAAQAGSGGKAAGCWWRWEVAGRAKLGGLAVVGRVCLQAVARREGRKRGVSRAHVSLGTRLGPPRTTQHWHAFEVHGPVRL